MVVFVTGMSGTGKSAALVELGRRGHRVVDTDYGGYSEEVPSDDAGGREQLWREERIAGCSTSSATTSCSSRAASPTRAGSTRASKPSRC